MGNAHCVFEKYLNFCLSINDALYDFVIILSDNDYVILGCWRFSVNEKKWQFNYH